jgi:RNA polymerase sigma-70 factor (ECF subfamily)
VDDACDEDEISKEKQDLLGGSAGSLLQKRGGRTRMMNKHSQNSEREHDQAGAFPKTRWSLMLAAGGEDAGDQARALGELCRLYWYPLYLYVRRRGLTPEDAQDSTQAFFEHLIGARVFERVGGKENGRLRSYLLTSMQRWLMQAYRRENAAKRGGGSVEFSLDAVEGEERYRLEPKHDANPEAMFERRWALDLIAKGLQVLKQDYERAGKSVLYRVLAPWLTSEAGQGELTRVAEELKLTPGHVRVHLHRLKKHFRSVLRDQIASTVGTEEEVADEMRHLQAVLSR